MEEGNSQKSEGTQYNLDDTVTGDTSYPLSSTPKQGGSEDTSLDVEDYITVAKSEGTQTVSTSTEGTQTSSEYSSNTFMAILANRLLHGSYWYLLLSIVLENDGLFNIRNNLEMRKSVSEAAAKRIMTYLAVQGSLVIADITKPDFDLEHGNCVDAISIVAKLDRWLLTSVWTAIISAKDGNNPERGNEEQIAILENINVEFSVLAEESKLMNSDTFLDV